MRRLTGDDGAPEAPAYQQPRHAKRKRHGRASGREHKPQNAPPTSVPVAQRADSLAACGFSLGAALLRDVAGACTGWRGSDAAARCDVCGCGPGAHALLDTRSGNGAPDVRRAYMALREARALGYCAAAPGSPLEATLAAHATRLSRLLRSAASISAQAEQAASLLPGIGSRPASALRIVALLDESYAELFIGDCLAPPAASAALPPPHVHLAALLPALPAASGTCSECGASTPAAAGLLCRACAAINPQLAYIRLRDAEAAVPLGLRRLAAACLAAEGASPGPSGGTQRGVDPMGCDTLRRWQAAMRDRVAAWSAFACPDAAAARALGAFAVSGAGGALLEVGAGTGYWARYLERTCASMRVAAHDVRPPVGAGKGRLNEYHASLPCWAAVQPGDAAAVAATAASAAVRAGKPPPVLFICYPPPCMTSDGKNDMALASLTAFAAAGGRQLALVGEWRGDTGSAALERALSSGWTLDAAPLALPGFANTCAALTLWRRGAAVPAPLRWAPACVACGAAQPGPVDAARKGSERPFLRDRLTRAVVVCSHACARAPAATTALDAELRARNLPPLRHQRASSAATALPFAWEDCDAALGKLVWRSVGV